jgi:translation initiation factor 3 subunit B
MYDFKGELLREEHIEKFKQFLWRPRPVTMLSKEEQKQIRKNLREYSKDFEEQDKIADDQERGAVVDERRRLFREWLAWREQEEEELLNERRELGLPDKAEDAINQANGEDGEEAQVVEEIVEEIVDETIEVMP